MTKNNKYKIKFYLFLQGALQLFINYSTMEDRNKVITLTQEPSSSQDPRNIFASPYSSTQLNPKLSTTQLNPDSKYDPYSSQKYQEQSLEFPWRSPVAFIDREKFLQSIPNNDSPVKPWTPSPSMVKKLENSRKDSFRQQPSENNYNYSFNDKKNDTQNIFLLNPFTEDERMDPDPVNLLSLKSEINGPMASFPLSMGENFNGNYNSYINQNPYSNLQNTNLNQYTNLQPNNLTPYTNLQPTNLNPYNNLENTNLNPYDNLQANNLNPYININTDGKNGGYRFPTPPKPKIEAPSPYEYQWKPNANDHLIKNSHDLNDESSWQQAVKKSKDFKPQLEVNYKSNPLMIQQPMESHVPDDVSMGDPDDSSNEYSTLLNCNDDLLGLKKYKVKDHMDIFLTMIQQYSDPYKPHPEIMDHYSHFIKDYGGWYSIVEDIEEKYNISYRGKNPNQWMTDFEIKGYALILSTVKCEKKINQNPLDIKLNIAKFNDWLKKNTAPNGIKKPDLNKNKNENPWASSSLKQSQTPTIHHIHGHGRWPMMGVPSRQPKQSTFVQQNSIKKPDNYQQNTIIKHLYQQDFGPIKSIDCQPLPLGQNFVYIDEDDQWHSGSSSEAEKIILNCCKIIGNKKNISQQTRDKISKNLNKIFRQYRYDFLGKSIDEIQQLVQKKRAIKVLAKNCKQFPSKKREIKCIVKNFQEDKLSFVADGHQGQQQWKKIIGVGSKRKALSMGSSPQPLKRFKEDGNGTDY